MCHVTVSSVCQFSAYVCPVTASESVAGFPKRISDEMPVSQDKASLGVPKALHAHDALYLD
jgi:hypothetical protein